MNKAKKILILIVTFILLFLLFIIMIFRSKGGKVSQKQFVLPSPVEERFNQKPPAQNNLVIKNFFWKKITGSPPEKISYLKQSTATEGNSKRAPIGNTTALIANGQLNIDRGDTRLQ